MTAAVYRLAFGAGWLPPGSYDARVVSVARRRGGGLDVVFAVITPKKRKRSKTRRSA